MDGGIARLRLNRPEVSNGLNAELLQVPSRSHPRLSRRPQGPRCPADRRRAATSAPAGTFTPSSPRAPDLPDYLRGGDGLAAAGLRGVDPAAGPRGDRRAGLRAGGGGLGLVCASDIVVARRNRRSSSPVRVRVGMAPDGGVSVTLTQLVGLRQALRIVLTNPDAHRRWRRLRDRADHRGRGRRRTASPRRGNRREQLVQLPTVGALGDQASGLERCRRVSGAAVGRGSHARCPNSPAPPMRSKAYGPSSNDGHRGSSK